MVSDIAEMVSGTAEAVSGNQIPPFNDKGPAIPGGWPALDCVGGGKRPLPQMRLKHRVKLPRFLQIG